MLRRLWFEWLWRTTSGQRWLERARSHEWVFVAGCNRSGKTTLANLIGQHLDVSVIPNANTHTRALPESTREGCPHVWVEKLERFRLTETDDRTPMTRLAFDWLCYHRNPRRMLVLESDIPAIQMRWLQEVFPGAALVGVVRNGFSVAEGLRRKEGYSIDRCARQWATSTRIMLEDAPRLHRFHLVRYEDLVARPIEVVNSLCHFLGLDPDSLIPFIERGWRMGNTDRHVSILRDGNAELIRSLSRDDIARIAENASGMLVTLGYSVPAQQRS